MLRINMEKEKHKTKNTSTHKCKQRISVILKKGAMQTADKQQGGENKKQPVELVTLARGELWVLQLQAQMMRVCLGNLVLGGGSRWI